jgi:ABC-type dipeptide/oligopeptide/nickel transport system permease subunit
MSATADALVLEPLATDKPISQWGLAWRRLRRHKLAMIGLVTIILIVAASLLASVLAPYDYDELDLKHPYAPFMTAGIEGRPVHLLGTDALGRDIASRLLYAGRISLAVALIVSMLNITVGTVIGAVAGAAGGLIRC